MFSNQLRSKTAIDELRAVIDYNMKIIMADFSHGVSQSATCISGAGDI
nr:hypothetical protein [uncultured bacterium]